MLSAVTRSKGNDSVSEARPFRATLSTIEGPAIHEGSLVPAKAIVRRFRVSCPAGSMSQSQSLFRSYGSVLPTSLTYIRLYPEAVHLGDLMRSSVRSGTGVLCHSLGFSRSVRLSKDPAESTGLWRFLDAPVSLAPLGAIRGIGGASARTDNSAFRSTVGFPESRRFTARDLSIARHLDNASVRHPKETVGATRVQVPESLRDPLSPMVRAASLDCYAVVASPGVLLRLRTDSPMCKGCSHGTLPLVNSPGSRSSTRYYHQDLRRRRLQAGLRPDPSAHIAATFLLSEP